MAGRKVVEVKLRFRWDEHVIQFLERQKKLAVVQVQPPEYGLLHPAAVAALTGDRTGRKINLTHGSLPLLRVFDGTLEAALDVARVGAPLTNLQAVVERDSTDAAEGVDPYEGLEEDLRGFMKLRKSLKSLNLCDVPEDLVGDIINVLAVACPELVYLGLLPLPVLQREMFTKGLLSFHFLRLVHLDISKWTPHPNVTAQRALAAELIIFCPTIRQIVFWYHSTRYKWQYNQEKWYSQVDNRQHPQGDQTWSLV